MQVGIEAMNVFTGTAYLDFTKLAEYRKLDMTRFNNLLMKQKTVALPYEDPITFGVNAAKPIIEAWFKKSLFWVANRVTKPTNRWYKPQLHCSSLKTQY